MIANMRLETTIQWLLGGLRSIMAVSTQRSLIAIHLLGVCMLHLKRYSC